MALKRMFSLSVTDTDKFMEMSTSAQALYFHLGMHGDDDGFVAAPRKTARAAGCNDDDLRLLVQKGYIILFESGIIVITDWAANNTLKNDRYKATVYQEEKALLTLEKSGRYALGSTLEPEWNQSGTNLEPQRNLTKRSLTEHSLTEHSVGVPRGTGADKPPTARTAVAHFKKPAFEEVDAYFRELGDNRQAPAFYDYYEGNGWRIGKNPMKDWKAAVRNWQRRSQEYDRQPPQPSRQPKPQESYSDQMNRVIAQMTGGKTE